MFVLGLLEHMLLHEIPTSSEVKSYLVSVQTVTFLTSETTSSSEQVPSPFPSSYRLLMHYITAGAGCLEEDNAADIIQLFFIPFVLSPLFRSSVDVLDYFEQSRW